jgi:hypothetical protein
VPGKVKPVRTHRGGDATTGRRGRLGTAMFRWMAALAIIDECGEVLQLEGDKGVRKWRLIEETGGSRRCSPMNDGQRCGSSEILCRSVSSGCRRWRGGGVGCQASSCGRGRGEKLGKKCHTPFRERGNEASIRVPRMFKSHAWQQYDKQMQCYK